ncbi:nitroreductase [Clostridium acetobutylicum]|uniref:Nitroreductase family protein n=1 Tax=Clostridium acetobutylicum (strain ATCC 824 / DSM 792 / JCM 1419 / IAM 19013 / LMG 5710 / NBRC 13948 / NRRL B-527 / VKM B-1787 / 2291 / W) TaxID=272562 RepID=Q97DC3_CLOAB|nr:MULTISPECIES: nitroreductase family protein [Clostridium]AAK81480.1 Nitroreductase family protein [Clostridium acetobutylicum ATCC 824]ADZ22598.1 Nitroreductase family protein [Clostridium acetobutylicum EA 2018]AEI32928.1 nitroreductase family protein [Clostridium acetobutylicum DSM 1731]AWV80847.1 NAD(P)H nitroreductase [Clostridium acetobutylicum]MBC2393826.1 NAD(P)H nitroreductase [Clostridium acetobutylicum]
MIDLLKTRRSIRKYKNKEIEKEKVDTLLKAALLAPTSMGKRSWEFIAVTNKNLISELSTARKMGSQFLKGAPLVIVVVENPEATDAYIEDGAIASTLIQVTAHSMGLGSCWCHVRNRDRIDYDTTEAFIKTLLNIPENLKVECMLGIGYPDEERKAYTDEDLALNKLHYDKYSK